MEVILSSISAGGLLGAGNQYLCLLIISIAAKTGLVRMAPEMGFMQSWWFIGIVALFWIITVAPAYATFLSPGVMHVINTIANTLSGFVVPISAALLALATAGAIAGMDPTFRDILRSLQIFNVAGDGIGRAGLLIAGGSAVAATALTGARFLSKPVLSAVTGTTGTVSAPVYATIENAVSVILMVLLYVFSKINPWLLVGLLALITLLILGVLAYAIYQLWRLGRGIGRAISLIETRPKAGLAIVAEFLVWGSGWLIWKHWNRGIFRLIAWALWLAIVILAIPAGTAALSAAAAVVPPLVMLTSGLGFAVEAVVVVIGLTIGLRSARGLMQTFDEVAPAPVKVKAPAPLPA